MRIRPSASSTNWFSSPRRFAGHELSPLPGAAVVFAEDRELTIRRVSPRRRHQPPLAVLDHPARPDHGDAPLGIFHVAAHGRQVDGFRPGLAVVVAGPGKELIVVRARPRRVVNCGQVCTSDTGATPCPSGDQAWQPDWPTTSARRRARSPSWPTRCGRRRCSVCTPGRSRYGRIPDHRRCTCGPRQRPRAIRPAATASAGIR